MAPELIGVLAAATISWVAYLHKKVDIASLALETFKTEVARTYVPREQIDRDLIRLSVSLDRIEDKIDYHMMRGAAVPKIGGHVDASEKEN